MTKSLPWTTNNYRMVVIADPQPRDPGTANRSPNRPRPANPVQPRDDGQSRSLFLMHTSMACPDKDNDDDKESQPRDGGHGRRLGRGPHPRDDGSNGVLGLAYGVKQSDPQPRDPGNGKRAGRKAQAVQPRDAGF